MARQAEETRKPAQAAPRERPVWRVGMAGPFSSFALAERNAMRGWRLLSAVALGMIVTVALLSVVPIYATLVSNTQIAAEMSAADPTSRNMEITAHIIPYWQAGSSGVDSEVNGIRGNDMPAGAVTATTEYLEADHAFSLAKVNGFTLGSKAANRLLPLYALNGQLDFLTYNYASAGSHMKLLAGRLPKETKTGVPPEVIVTPAFDAKPGMKLIIADPANKKRLLTVTVVGVWFPKDENDPFWNGRGFSTVVPTLTTKLSQPPVYPVLFDRSSFEQTLSYQPASPGEQPLGMVVHYIWYIGPRAVTVDNQTAVVASIQQVRNDLNGNVLGTNDVTSVGLATHLDQILGQGQSLLGLLRLPLYSVAAQLVVMALLFIMTMVGLLIESQGGVIATLRSRGASVTQMLVSYIAQGTLMAGLALAVGPLLAMALGLFVIVTFVPAARETGITFSLSAILGQTPFQQAFQPALAGAGLGLVALIAAVWQASRADVLAFRRRQGRLDRAPFWQRYYLDLGLAALVIAGYSQLASFGALGTRTQLENAGAAGSFDLIQTLTPSLMMVVGALLILRVTPWLLRFGAWLAARGRGATGMMAFSQLSRASGTFNRLALLLALSVGVGLFALSFQTTLARTAVNQARYLTGGDERVVIKPPDDGTQLTAPYLPKFEQMPGVRAVSMAYRSYGLTTANFNSENVDILGVDPATFGKVAAWDPGDASQSLASLMGAMKSDEQGAQAGDSTHPIPALVSAQFAQTLSLSAGSKFSLTPKETLDSNPIQFVIIGIVTNFPTMYNEFPDGYVVTDVNDYLAALGNPYLAGYPINGPNEFWIKTTGDQAAAAKRAKALDDPNFFVQQTLDARQLTTEYQSDPLSAGMTGLLLVGAMLAGLLALIALLAQAGAATRQRATQFAVLRTLGMGRGTLLRILLSEQAVIYATGALGGVALSALLAYTAIPFLSFSTSTYQPPVVGVPGPELAVNISGSMIFLLALVAMFALALVIAGFVAQSAGLGKALRVGED